MNFIKYLFPLLFCFSIIKAQIPNTWVQKASLPDTARAGAFSFSIGNKGYLGGGYFGGQHFVKDFWEYDPTTDTWTRKNDLPFDKRAFGISFSCNGKGYIGLGQDTAFTNSYYNDLWEYNPVNDSWSQKMSFPGGGRISASCFLIDTMVYIGMGKSIVGAYLNDWWAYNTLNDTWIQKASLPTSGKVWSVAFASSTKGYLGFGNSIVQVGMKELWEYNPQADVWLQKNDFPAKGRTAAMGININGKLFIGGGNSNGFSNNDFWEYFPAFDAWVQKCNMPYSFSGSAIFTINNKGYFCTGYNYENNKNIKYLYEYSTDTLEYNGIDNPKLNYASCYAFPNPTSDKITFQYNIDSKPENVNNKIEVYNTMGQSVLTLPVFIAEGRNTASISISTLGKGVYFYKIANDIKGSFVVEK